MFAEEAEPAVATAQRASGAAALADSYDDAEGYYNLQARCQCFLSLSRDRVSAVASNQLPVLNPLSTAG